MKKLEWLQGQWKGEAWFELVPGQRQTVMQTENVLSKLGGLALVVEGTGKMKLPGQAEEVPVFNALAIISYDDRAQRYRFHAYNNGQFADAEAKVTAGGVEWALPSTPLGKIRYTIKRTEAGKWFEIGERSQDDGKTWTKFFEMTLERLKSP
jgi:hypothetical protein